jgi:uncharacterized DUF497 family protein
MEAQKGIVLDAVQRAFDDLLLHTEYVPNSNKEPRLTMIGGSLKTFSMAVTVLLTSEKLCARRTTPAKLTLVGFHGLYTTGPAS